MDFGKHDDPELGWGERTNGIKNRWEKKTIEASYKSYVHVTAIGLSNINYARVD